MRDDGRIAQIGIQRRPDGRPFAGRNTAALDRPTFDPPVPECGRAVLDGLAATLAVALDDLPGGLIVLGADGRTVHMNRAVQTVVGRADGIGVERSGAIVLASAVAARQLPALLRGILQGVPDGDRGGGVLRVPRRHGRAPYTLLVSPRPRGAMVLIHDPDCLPPPPPAMLRRVFGLTRREAELVGALIAGIGTTGFALQAGISLNTVRYHLKSIYAKVGVRGQTGLMRTVVTAVAVLGGERHAPLWRAARE